MKFPYKLWTLISGMTLSLALIAGCNQEETPPDNATPPAAPEAGPATPPATPPTEPAPAVEAPKAEAAPEETLETEAPAAEETEESDSEE